MSKSLEELKNELCKIKKISDSRDFKNGWDEAIKAVSERDKKLVEALETSIFYQEKAKSFISHYDDCNALIDEESEGPCACGMDTFSHDNYIAICSGKIILKEFRGLK